MKRDIKSMYLSELEEHFKEIGLERYRAKQVFSWLHKGVRDFEQMTNLSLNLRESLDREFFITSPAVIRKQVSKLDGTIKYLWRLHDGEAIESVLMSYAHGNSVCISTQVGCKMGCLFCASAIGGFRRDLTAAEMLDQVLFTQQDSGKKISNIVLMGIGEPLDNFENVMRFTRLVRHEAGINIGSRHLTVSTCGIVENIDRLAEYGVQLTLAISLHASEDSTRMYLIPSSRNAPVKKLIEACDRYFEKTGRRVTYEYALIDGVNDSPEHAEKLSKLLAKAGSHLNLITLSKFQESNFEPSSAENMDKFTEVLRDNNINFTVRRSLGADINASCGELRWQTLD
ncbi:MAG: 23S rRNA (adenine(2503)-C(2))-methyltransferase RlmN [Oscillospiraceae bacterium]|nr:23S rRNA (adenine(2503)-C(2))-methyltransferase RlmN [Oscillospiraceae bacterium]